MNAAAAKLTRAEQAVAATAPVAYAAVLRHVAANITNGETR